MFYVYILFSKSLDKFYTGQTANLERRLIRHNSKLVRSTKNGIPWDLRWSTQVPSRAEAVLLEQKIKKRGARRYLNDIGM